MSSWQNLKDAGRLLPGWVTPFFLSAAVVGLYVLARYSSADKPHDLIAFGSLVTIVCSMVVGFALLIQAIYTAKAGTVLTAIGDGFQRGLTYVWVTAAISLFAYVGSAPVWRLMTENLYYTLTTVVVLALLAAGYWASGVRQKPEGESQGTAGATSTALALPAGFMPTVEQRPAFQITMADETRLMIHQAARIIAYHGSDCLIADSFSASLDLNARTAKIFTEMNLLSTPAMLYWRMHMLLIGSAAEHIIRNTNSEAAMDDMQNFEEVAVRYLLLEGKGNLMRPVSEAEGMLRANRVQMLHRSVMGRCVEAVQRNKAVILDLIKLMRARPWLAHADIKHLMARVDLPEDFPRAEFDSNEQMEQALAQICHERPSALVEFPEEAQQDDTVPDSNVVEGKFRA